MKLEEYKALLANAIADPDKAKEISETILSGIEADFAANEAAANEIKKQYEAQTAKVTELTARVNAYKAKEFLGAVGAPKEPYDPLKEAAKIAGYVINPERSEK